MKTLIVGDIHGHIESVEKALATDYNVLFIGDYLDSFTRGPVECVATLKVVLNAINQDPDRVQGLIGNHELSYFDPKYRCSGYNKMTQKILHSESIDFTPLKKYTYVGDFLVSHAGVSQNLLNWLHISLEEYLEIKDFDQVGWFRGGQSPVGGLFWCDWNREFTPLTDGPKQIVGHTHHNRIKAKEGNYCIDALNHSNLPTLIVDDQTNEVEVNLL